MTCANSGRGGSPNPSLRRERESLAPLANLMRMHIEALGQLRERGLAFHGREGDLRFERWRVVTTGTTGHREGSESMDERSSVEPTCPVTRPVQNSGATSQVDEARRMEHVEHLLPCQGRQRPRGGGAQ